jgi:hypothetical protein
MRLDKARAHGTQRPVDMALHPRTSPETSKSWHGR